MTGSTTYVAEHSTAKVSIRELNHAINASVKNEAVF